LGNVRRRDDEGVSRTEAGADDRQGADFDSFSRWTWQDQARGYGAGSFYAYYEKNDPKKRLLVIADYSQMSVTPGSGRHGFMPIDVSNEAFKLGVNYIVYALTH